MGLLDRYILRSVATPLVLSLCVAGMLLLVEHMLRLFDFVLAEQGPIGVVWRMLSNLVPHYLSLALPLGAFLGVLLAFRNLSLSSELDAMNSSGVSFVRLMRPVYALLLFLLVFDFVLVGYVQPLSRYRFQRIEFDVTSGAFGIKIPQAEFIEVSDKVTIRLGSVDKETREARDVFLEMRRADGRRTVITANGGSISTTPGLDKLLLKLRDGRQLLIAGAGDRIESLNFDSFDLTIDLPALNIFRPRGAKADESTFSEVAARLAAGGERTPLWLEDRAQFHWTLIHPLTFLVMPILAVAMGVTGRRRSSNMKPIAGVAILIVYHELLEEWGQAVAANGSLSPYVSMWGLLAVFMALSALLYVGSIEKARTAKAASRSDDDTIRLPAPVAASAGARARRRAAS